MNLLSVTYKDLQVFVRDRGAVFMLFLLPFAFIAVLSLATQGVRLGQSGASGQTRIPLTVVNNDVQGQAAQEFLATLNDTGKVQIDPEDQQAKVERQLNDATLRYALFIPADFSAKLAAGDQVSLRLALHPYADQADLLTVERAIVRAAREYLMMGYLNDGLEQMAAMQAANPQAASTFSKERIQQQIEAQQAQAEQRPLITVVTTTPAVKSEGQTATEEELPTYGQFLVVGMAVLFVFLAAQNTARSIYEEKREGTFRRLMAAPIGKTSLLGGKLVPNFILVLVQIVVILVTGGFVIQLFGLPPLNLGTDLLGLVVVCVATALCSTCLGIFIAAIAQTESQISGFSTLVLLLAGMLGGAFVPLFLFPGGLANLSRMVPHYWAVQGLYGLIFRGQTLADVWPNAVALLAFAAAFLVIGVRRFKFE